MENLRLYNDVRKVPKGALKEIQGGKLKGKSDINPMWRIKTLTEQYGPCGIGWYYEITQQWLEHGENGEVAGFCNINLYVKSGDQWSKPITGTGGSSFISKTKNGLEISDEVYKMALTDAISVACKALGFGADVYWGSDKTKFDKQSEAAKQAQSQTAQVKSSPDREKAAQAQKEEGVGETELDAMVLDIMSSADLKEITEKWNAYKKYDIDKKITSAVIARRNELGV